MKLKYNKLIYNLNNANFNYTCFKSVTFYPNRYFIINSKFAFHITVFKDQWNNYPIKKYALFHVTYDPPKNSTNKKCSLYFRVDNDMNILDIPKNEMKYKKKDYGMFRSTREKCTQKIIKKLKNDFQKILKKM